MTNREELSKLSVDEMVRFFQQTGGCPPKYTFGHCPAQDMPDAILNGDHCGNCWFDWLEEDVEEDGTR
jgi:hypothetical protein